MLLDESDIESIVEHLGDTVQFYDARGVADNEHARHKIRHALRSYVGTPSSKAAERFCLIEIAFKEALRDPEAGSSYNVAIKVTDYVRAVLAAMETEPTETPGPSSLAAVRAEVEARHDRNVKRYAETPTEFRDGVIDGLAHALKIVDAAMEKPEAETNDGK